MTENKSPQQLGIGQSSFVRLREDHCLYIDKSAFVREVANAKKVQVYLRPRRFGKTLALSMLDAFFNCQAPRPELFDGLEISEDRAFCAAHQNQYPVLRLSLKNLDTDNFEKMREKLAYELAQLVREHKYLLESEKLAAEERDFLQRLAWEKASLAELEGSLLRMSHMLHAHHGRRCVILLDEYDVPLNSAYGYGYLDLCVPLIRSFMLQSFKDNDALAYAVITGCLRISRESIYTGMNNVDIHTILRKEEREWFGFTPEEVSEVLSTFGLAEQMPAVQHWYDGYLFGQHEVYNPWSILNYLTHVELEHPEQALQAYWINTSANSILVDLLGRASSQPQLRNEVERLFRDEAVCHKVAEQTTYASLTGRETTDALWSTLLFTGYLKPAAPAGSDDMVPLVLPNREVKEALRRMVDDWMCNSCIPHMPGAELELALAEGRAEDAQQLLARLLLQTISYYDYAETYYHAFLAGLLASLGNVVVWSNRESGEGRPDILAVDIERGIAMVLELKIARQREEMMSRAQEALEQAQKSRYGEELENWGCPGIVRHYGVAFFRKNCQVIVDNV